MLTRDMRKLHAPPEEMRRQAEEANRAAGFQVMEPIPPTEAILATFTRYERRVLKRIVRGDPLVLRKAMALKRAGKLAAAPPPPLSGKR